MAKRIATEEEQRLAERLRREAQAARPVFSEQLHARICRAVQQYDAGVRVQGAAPAHPGLPETAESPAVNPEASTAPQRAHGVRHLRILPRRWWQRFGWLRVAVAAALLLSVPLAAWWLHRSPGLGVGPGEIGRAPLEVPEAVPDPDMITGPVARTAEHLRLLVDPTASAGQWAYLDHDARVAYQLLMDQLPLDIASME
jgi:hypothetical protein